MTGRVRVQEGPNTAVASTVSGYPIIWGLYTHRCHSTARGGKQPVMIMQLAWSISVIP